MTSEPTAEAVCTTCSIPPDDRVLYEDGRCTDCRKAVGLVTGERWQLYHYLERPSVTVQREAIDLGLVTSNEVRDPPMKPGNTSHHIAVRTLIIARAREQGKLADIFPPLPTLPEPVEEPEADAPSQSTEAARERERRLSYDAAVAAVAFGEAHPDDDELDLSSYTQGYRDALAAARPEPPVEGPIDGLHEKFTVFRNDGRDRAGGDKEGARYFVLDYIHDPIAQSALDYYAKLARNEGLVELADDLDEVLRDGRNTAGGGAGGPAVWLAVDSVEARYEAHLRLERSKR